jgi:hypothetical protein
MDAGLQLHIVLTGSAVVSFNMHVAHAELCPAAFSKFSFGVDFYVKVKSANSPRNRDLTCFCQNLSVWGNRPWWLASWFADNGGDQCAWPTRKVNQKPERNAPIND